MPNRIWLPFMILLLLGSACAGRTPVDAPPPSPLPEDPNASPLPPGTEPPPLNPYAPGKGDEALQRSILYIDSQQVVALESFPVQFQLRVTGSLPTPCHQLRAVVDEQPDAQNRIHVEIFSLAEPDKVCADVLEPFDAAIPLGGFASGTYTVVLNGEAVGEIRP